MGVLEEGGRKEHLTGCEMAETTNQPCFVKGVGSGLHPTYRLHLLVHCEELFLGDGDVEIWRLALMRLEGIVMKPDGEGG